MAKRIVFLGLIAVLKTLFGMQAFGVLPSYSFINFETDTGWQAGPLLSIRPSLRLEQGQASIIPYSEEGSQQVLQLGPSEPVPALFVDATAGSKGAVSYCEVLAKPFAKDQNSNEDFFDFGGAVVGFFRAGEYGEVRALFANSDTDSVWISTGLRFNLDEAGCASDWLRISVKLNRESGRWDLKVDGLLGLAGLKAVPGEAGGLALWLYGDGKHPYLYDDIYIGMEDPDRLEKMIAWQMEREARSHAETVNEQAAKTVVQSEPNADIRQMQPKIAKLSHVLPDPVLRGLGIVFQSGGSTVKGWAGMNDSEPAWLVHGISYDEHGKPLPAQITLAADAELKPGADLSRIRWFVAEISTFGKDRMIGISRVISTGNFSTGLVQTISIPGEEAATHCLCEDIWIEGDSNYLHKHYKFQGGGVPAVLQ